MPRAVRDNALSLFFLVDVAENWQSEFLQFFLFIAATVWLVQRRTLHNWQSEFLAVGTMVAFSIYLRQRGSAESKPVGAPHHLSASESE